MPNAHEAFTKEVRMRRRRLRPGAIVRSIVTGCWLLSWFAAWPLGQTTASAQVPHLIRYQGQAVDSKEIPLEGPYTLTFRLYDAQTAGTVVWQEIQPNVPITKGQFSILLGQVSPLNADWNKTLWLSIQVGIEPELSPRQQLTAVPLAIRAEEAERLVGAGADVSIRVSNSGAPSIPNVTETALTFDTERWDTDTIHSTSSNTSRLTAKTAGKYLIFGNVRWTSNGTGIRIILIKLNGTTNIAYVRVAAIVTDAEEMQVVTHYHLAANDYVELYAYQSSGGSLDITVSGEYSPVFGMVKVP